MTRPPPSPRVTWGLAAYASALSCKTGSLRPDDLGPLFVLARRFLPTDAGPFEAVIALARDSVHAPGAAGDAMISFLDEWVEPEGGHDLFAWQRRLDCGL